MRIKISYVLITMFVSTVLFANAHTNDADWGDTGHRVVGEIASKHLSKRVQRKIRKLLNGQGLAMVSTYADAIKSDDAYRRYGTWHYVNMNDDETYENSKKNPKGDLVTGIAKCKQVLMDAASSKEEKVFHLKMLVHLIGDLHQPLHVGRVSDRGGNDFKVQWFYKGSNMHRVWDSEMINSFNMTYTELANNTNVLSKAQIKSLQEGTVIDWANESKEIAQKVYRSAKPEENLRYRYMYDYFETVREQLQKGGIRLAKVLETIF